MRQTPWAAWLRDIQLLIIAFDPDFTYRQRLALGSGVLAVTAIFLL